MENAALQTKLVFRYKENVSLMQNELRGLL